MTNTARGGHKRVGGQEADGFRVFYEYVEETGHSETLKAASLGEALAEARSLLRAGDWGQAGSRKSIHVEAVVRVLDEDGGEVGGERHPVSARIDPKPPEPEGISHDWQSPHQVLGGMEENPGVFGKGGGAVVTEVCANTGWYRVTDGWDQSQGPEPVETIEYEEPDHESLNWAAFADPQRVTVLLDENTPGVESFAAEIQEEYGYETHIGLGSPSGRLEIEIEGVTDDVAQSPAVRDMESRIEERLEAWIEENK